MRRFEAIALPLFTAAIILVAWHYGVRFTESKIFPTPIDVFKGLGQLFQRGLLLSYIRDSLARVAVGYVIAVVLGIPFGILISWYPQLGRAFNPLIQLLRPISPLAWMPLAIIWFGISNIAPIFLIFLGAFFPIVVATMNGVRNIPAMYLQAGRNFGLSSWHMMRRVVLPAILPRVLTGLRIALGIAWLVVVAAEMIAVDSGLGYLIIDSRNAGKRYDLVVAGMLLIGVIGLGLDLLLRRAERWKSVRWGFNQ